MNTVYTFANHCVRAGQVDVAATCGSREPGEDHVAWEGPDDARHFLDHSDPHSAHSEFMRRSAQAALRYYGEA